MKKTKRQSHTLVSSPPSTGPAAMATAPPAAQTATARARRAASSYACRISASEVGISTAAAAPCTTLAPISTPSVGARPQARDARVKTTRPQP